MFSAVNTVEGNSILLLTDVDSDRSDSDIKYVLVVWTGQR